MVSDKLIKELQVIVKEEREMEMTFEEAKRAGETLVNYFQLLIDINDRVKIVEKPKK